MPKSQARVTSLDDLEAFRASLVRYIEDARRALGEATSEARRTRIWLDNDRWSYWNRAVKLAERELQQAQQELFSANLSAIQTSDAFRKMAVRKARARRAEAEKKCRVVKRWRQVFDQQVDPLLRHLEGMHDKVSRELPEAVMFLDASIRNLQAYAESHAPKKKQKPAEDVPAQGDGESAEPSGEETNA